MAAEVVLTDGVEQVPANTAWLELARVHRIRDNHMASEEPIGKLQL